PIQASSHVDPYPLRAHAHGIADRTTHRAAEHDAPLQLLRYTFGDQLGVQLRLANLLHVHMDRNTHELAEIAPQALNVFALFAEHHARPRGVNGHQRVLGRPLDIDATDRSMTQLLLDVVPHLQVGIQIIGEIATIGVPGRAPTLGNTETEPCRMYFLTHDALSYSSPTITVM